MGIEASDPYRAAREELRVAEYELMKQRERVAELRRALPVDTVVPDYVFETGPDDLDRDGGVREVKLSELFTDPERTLVVYQFMYGKAQTEPCPMCTMWIDGYNAVAPHLSQRLDFVVLAAADIASLRAHARSRGWKNLRLVGAAESTFKRDLRSEEDDGTQIEMVSVFRKAGDGSVRLFYKSGAELAPDQRERGIDLLTPVWNMFDLTPEGRGDWYPSLSYDG